MSTPLTVFHSRRCWALSRCNYLCWALSSMEYLRTIRVYSYGSAVFALSFTDFSFVSSVKFDDVNI